MDISDESRPAAEMVEGVLYPFPLWIVILGHPSTLVEGFSDFPGHPLHFFQVEGVTKDRDPERKRVKVSSNRFRRGLVYVIACAYHQTDMSPRPLKA